MHMQPIWFFTPKVRKEVFNKRIDTCKSITPIFFTYIIADMSILTVFPLSLQICQFSQFFHYHCRYVNSHSFSYYHCRYVNSHSFSIIIADMSILTVFPLSLQICQFSQFFHYHCRICQFSQCLRRKKSIEKRRSESGSLRSKKQFCLPKAEKEQTQPQI